MAKARKKKLQAKPQLAQGSEFTETRVAILLAGEADPTPMRIALDAPTLCLPLAWDCSLLDAWQKACLEIGVREMRIVVPDKADVKQIEYALQMSDHSKIRVPTTRIIVDPESIRDTTGTVGRLTDDLEPEEMFLVLNACCLPPVSMSPIMDAIDKSILGVVGVDLRNDPSGVAAFRRSPFNHAPEEGALQLTPPDPVAMGGNNDKFIVVALESKCSRLTDRASYLDAVQEYKKRLGLESPNYFRDSSVFISDAAVIEGACVIEPGVVIEDNVIIYDSVVMAGATIQCGAVVTRSVIGSQAVIERDAKVLRLIEPSDPNLRRGREGGRGSGQDGWRKSA